MQDRARADIGWRERRDIGIVRTMGKVIVRTVNYSATGICDLERVTGLPKYLDDFIHRLEVTRKTWP